MRLRGRAMRWMIQEYMVKKRIRSLSELSRETGIEYRTLLNHINDVGKFRVFEIAALDEVLGFDNEDLLKILREAK